LLSSFSPCSDRAENSFSRMPSSRAFPFFHKCSPLFHPLTSDRSEPFSSHPSFLSLRLDFFCDQPRSFLPFFAPLLGRFSSFSFCVPTGHVFFCCEISASRCVDLVLYVLDFVSYFVSGLYTLHGTVHYLDLSVRVGSSPFSVPFFSRSSGR